MIEVRIHGRGGQGNVVAAYLLASAAIADKWHAVAFPAFGAERRGAPVAAFVRMAEQPFQRRDQIAHPDFLVIQDEALLHVEGVLDGLKPGGGVLVNSPRPNETLGIDAACQTVPATRLALDHLGRPIPNTALLSGFLALTGLFSPDALDRALAMRFSGKTLEANRHLADAALRGVSRGAWGEECRAATA